MTDQTEGARRIRSRMFRRCSCSRTIPRKALRATCARSCACSASFVTGLLWLAVASQALTNPNSRCQHTTFSRRRGGAGSHDGPAVARALVRAQLVTHADRAPQHRGSHSPRTSAQHRGTVGGRGVRLAPAMTFGHRQQASWRKSSKRTDANRACSDAACNRASKVGSTTTKRSSAPNAALEISNDRSAR